MADDTHSGPSSALGETVAELITEAIAIAARRGRSLTSVTLKGQHPLVVENLGRACLAEEGFAHVSLQVESGADPVRLAAVQTEPQGRPRGS